MIPRGDIKEDSLAIYGIPVSAFRQAGGLVLAATETAGTHNVSAASDIWIIKGEVANNETEVSESAFQFVLPAEYVSGGDVQIRVKHRAVGAGTLGSSTIDIEAFEQDGNGGISADLVTTAAQSTLDDTWTTSDFVVTSTALEPGSILNVVMTSSIVETATANINAEIDGVAVLLDVKG